MRCITIGKLNKTVTDMLMPSIKSVILLFSAIVALPLEVVTVYLLQTTVIQIIKDKKGQIDT